MSYFIYTDLISSLLDPKPVDPGSTLIYVGAYILIFMIEISCYIAKIDIACQTFLSLHFARPVMK